MLFQSELALCMLDLLGRSVGSGRWTPLQKQETTKDRQGSPVAAPMSKSILSGEREYQLLRK